jgi:4-hydroxy-tetrahydrodipicolinate synthase
MRLTGTMTAIVTPFDQNGRVDEDALRAHIHTQLDAGHDGIVPCGTTGETPTLSIEEFQQVVRATVEEVKGRVPVIAGTGSNNTRTSIETTRLARELGVDAALVVTPYYNKPGPAMLEAHFRKVASEGGLPVVLYNVPGRTGTNMTAPVVHALAAVDNIIAVKEASGNLSQVQAILGGVDTSRFTVLSGDDALALPMYSVGAHGVVSVAANLVPAEMRAVHRLFLAGDVAAAAAANARLFPLYEALFCESNPVPAKIGLELMGRMTSRVREPLGAGMPATVERLRAVLTELALL